MDPLGCREQECPENPDLRASREYQVTLESQERREKGDTLD
jgi:hypothetical protein